jgi:hypothetical protein
VDAVIVEAFIAVLKVAESWLPMGTPVAPLTGTVEVTVGAVGATGMVALVPPPVSMLTAPPIASARPDRVEPVAIVIDTAASMFP